jgi:hypothetical protein
MLQLRWVRRRVGAQAVAHRISARVNDLTARDRLEAAQAAAAVAAKSSRARPSSAASFRQQQQHASGHQPGDAAGAVLEWLTGKEELLLLQEMTHFLSCWHSYVMDGIRVKAWGRLEEVRHTGLLQTGLLPAEQLPGVKCCCAGPWSMGRVVRSRRMAVAESHPACVRCAVMAAGAAVCQELGPGPQCHQGVPQGHVQPVWPDAAWRQPAQQLEGQHAAEV